MSKDPTLERYSRQMRFGGIGEKGQQKLLRQPRHAVRLRRARHRAGEPSRPRRRRPCAHHRPRLHRDAQPAAAGPVRRERRRRQHARRPRPPRSKLRAVNSAVTVEPVVADIDRTNILELSKDADVILDGTDNFEIRYLINDVAVKLSKPWVYGGSHRQPWPDDDDPAEPDAVPALRLRGRPESGRGRHLRDGRRPVADRQHHRQLPGRRGVQDPHRPARHDQPRTPLHRLSGTTSPGASRSHGCSARSIVRAASTSNSSGSKANMGSQTTSLCGRNAVQVSHALAAAS